MASLRVGLVDAQQDADYQVEVMRFDLHEAQPGKPIPSTAISPPRDFPIDYRRGQPAS